MSEIARPRRFRRFALGDHRPQRHPVDARTTSRWYFVIAMGRKAGHLALGIGKAAGAEFAGRPIRLKTLVDTLAGAIIKRLSYGHRDGFDDPHELAKFAATAGLSLF